MRVITRTLIILATALLVVGATVALGQTGALASLGAGGDHRPQSQAYATTGGTGADTSTAVPTGAPPERGGHGEQGGLSLFGVVEIGKNLGVIAVIVAIVAVTTGLARRLMGGMRGRRSPPAAAA